jgi:hypothetical protein
MERQPVSSSMVASIGYDLEEETLEVEFISNGDIYQYFDVSFGVYHALVNADSIGEYMRIHILDKYDYSKVNRKRKR